MSAKFNLLCFVRHLHQTRKGSEHQMSQRFPIIKAIIFLIVSFDSCQLHGSDVSKIWCQYQTIKHLMSAPGCHGLARHSSDSELQLQRPPGICCDSRWMKNKPRMGKLDPAIATVKPGSLFCVRRVSNSSHMDDYRPHVMWTPDQRLLWWWTLGQINGSNQPMTGHKPFIKYASFSFWSQCG